MADKLEPCPICHCPEVHISMDTIQCWECGLSLPVEQIEEIGKDGVTAWNEMSQRVFRAGEAEKFHPRAMKLIAKQKPFIVIAYDEPYFKMAYDQIKLEEQLKGTWTSEDEAAYQDLEIYSTRFE